MVWYDSRARVCRSRGFRGYGWISSIYLYLIFPPIYLTWCYTAPPIPPIVPPSPPCWMVRRWAVSGDGVRRVGVVPGWQMGRLCVFPWVALSPLLWICGGGVRRWRSGRGRGRSLCSPAAVLVVGAWCAWIGRYGCRAWGMGNARVSLAGQSNAARVTYAPGRRDSEKYSKTFQKVLDIVINLC